MQTLMSHIPQTAVLHLRHLLKYTHTHTSFLPADNTTPVLCTFGGWGCFLGKHPAIVFADLKPDCKHDRHIVVVVMTCSDWWAVIMVQNKESLLGCFIII